MSGEKDGLLLKQGLGGLNAAWFTRYTATCKKYSPSPQKKGVHIFNHGKGSTAPSHSGPFDSPLRKRKEVDRVEKVSIALAQVKAKLPLIEPKQKDKSCDLRTVQFRLSNFVPTSVRDLGFVHHSNYEYFH